MMFVLFAPTFTACTVQEAQDFADGFGCVEAKTRKIVSRGYDR
jgi:hypothetical protein